MVSNLSRFELEPRPAWTPPPKYTEEQSFPMTTSASRASEDVVHEEMMFKLLGLEDYSRDGESITETGRRFYREMVLREQD